MEVKVHVQGFKGDAPINEGEEPSALLHGVIEIDGTLIEEIGFIEVKFAGGQLVDLAAHMNPGSFEVVTHTRESWPQLIAKIDGEREAKSGSGRLVAVKTDE